MAMKENSKKVLNYLKEINGDNVTAADVAAALGLEKRSVDGIFTSAIQRKGYGVRVPAEIELEDGTHKQVKFLTLTPAGMSFDPDAVELYNYNFPNTKNWGDITKIDETKLPRFKDISADSWYYNAVCWAFDKKITNGRESFFFCPDNSVTRAELATFILRYVAQFELKLDFSTDDIVINDYENEDDNLNILIYE